MTRRMIPFDNPEAVAWAREFFTTLRTQRDPSIGVHWLAKEGSRRAWIDVLKILARADIHQLLATIDEAEAGWDLAHEALREIIIENDEAGENLPGSLANYQTKMNRGHNPKLKHTQKADSWLRYLAISYAVEALVTRWSLPATGRKGSACSVVSLTYGRGAPTARGVQNIWEKYSHWLARMQNLSAHLQRFTEKKLTA